MSTGVLMMAVGSAAAMSCAIVQRHTSHGGARSHRPVLDGGSSRLAADHQRAAACSVHEDGEILLLQQLRGFPPLRLLRTRPCPNAGRDASLMETFSARSTLVTGSKVMEGYIPKLEPFSHPSCVLLGLPSSPVCLVMSLDASRASGRPSGRRALQACKGSYCILHSRREGLVAVGSRSCHEKFYRTFSASHLAGLGIEHGLKFLSLALGYAVTPSRVFPSIFSAISATLDLGTMCTPPWKLFS